MSNEAIRQHLLGQERERSLERGATDDGATAACHQHHPRVAPQAAPTRSSPPPTGASQPDSISGITASPPSPTRYSPFHLQNQRDFFEGICRREGTHCEHELVRLSLSQFPMRHARLAQSTTVKRHRLNIDIFVRIVLAANNQGANLAIRKSERIGVGDAETGVFDLGEVMKYISLPAKGKRPRDAQTYQADMVP